ncbi:hypothetical protein LHK_01121 [Laribacter hongkongensis HLHK9]|uniref:Uncharacterized protein n=1 Tax=Laribacter hongkongensis (strain HLHK9) TaxID=557598 RepID=C1D6K6_LARHH|nr:hypothetical protein LHK_01121 [Laribacter hongkongensis HLHK9]
MASCRMECCIRPIPVLKQKTDRAAPFMVQRDFHGLLITLS